MTIDGKRTRVLAAPLIIEMIDEPGKCNQSYIKKIYEPSRKTLQLLVSRTAIIYDMCGIVAPLHAQLRKTVSIATQLCKGQFEADVDRYLWELFVEQLKEVAKATQFRYRRIPTETKKVNKNVTLLVLTSSISMIISAYLVYNIDKPPDEQRSILILAKSYLTGNSTTIPKAELQEITLGATIIKQLCEEFKEILRNAFLLTDSKVSIFWTLKNNETLSIFVRNRCENITRKLNEAENIINQSPQINT